MKGKDGIIGILIVLIFTGPLLSVSAATVNWSDNFNDLEYEGWICHEQYGVNKWTCRDGCLCINQEYPGVIYRSSTSVVGTWQFEVKAGAPQMCVYFMSVHTDDMNWIGYGIHIKGIIQQESDILRISLIKKSIMSSVKYEPSTLPFSGEILSYCDSEFCHMSGIWQLISVSRSSSGDFSVYLNDSLLFEVNDFDYSASEYFTIAAQEYLSIDTIVVYDEIAPESENGSQSYAISTISITMTCITGLLYIGYRREKQSRCSSELPS